MSTEAPRAAVAAPPPRAVALALATCALLLAPTLGYRMALDQGVFAYLGAEWLEGRWPYLDTWDHAFPGLAFLQALEIALLGRSQAAFRAFDFAFQLASAWLIFRIAWALGARAGAWLGAASFALIYQGYGPWNTAQREGFGLLFLLLGFRLWQSAWRRRGTACAAAIGLGLGLAASIKPTLAGFACAYAPLLRRPGRAALVGAAAALVPLAAFAGAYALRGGLGDLYEACVAYQREVYLERLGGGAPLAALLWERLTRLGPQAAGLALAYAPLLCFGPARAERAMLYLGYLASLAGVVAQGSFAGYHYLPGLGIGAVLLGSAFALLVERPLAALGRPPRTAAGLASVLVVAALPVYVEPARVARVVRGDFLGRPAPGELRVGTVFDLGEDVALADHLRAHTEAHERIQVWGHESLVYYLARRDAASRFQTSNPLVTRRSDGELTPMQRRWRAEFLRDLAQDPPRYVVITRDDHWWWAPEQRSSEQLLDDFPEWKRFVEERYALERRIGRFLVLRRQPR
jgi:hypothetical protein